MIRRLTLATLVPACLALQAVYAQCTFGDLRGVTRDPSGLPLPRAVVTAHSLDENSDRKSISGEDGSFTFENLKPGHYRLTATMEGFQKSAAIEVELSARQSLRVDISMAIAAIISSRSRGVRQYAGTSDA